MRSGWAFKAAKLVLTDKAIVLFRIIFLNEPASPSIFLIPGLRLDTLGNCSVGDIFSRRSNFFVNDSRKRCKYRIRRY